MTLCRPLSLVLAEVCTLSTADFQTIYKLELGHIISVYELRFGFMIKVGLIVAGPFNTVSEIL